MNQNDEQMEAEIGELNNTILLARGLKLVLKKRPFYSWVADTDRSSNSRKRRSRRSWKKCRSSTRLLGQNLGSLPRIPIRATLPSATTIATKYNPKCELLSGVWGCRSAGVAGGNNRR